MEWLFVAIAVAALAALRGFDRSRQRQLRAPVLWAAAQGAGLTDVLETGASGLAVSGRSGPLRVRLEDHPGIHGAGSQILVDGFGFASRFGAGAPSLVGEALIRRIRDGEITREDLDRLDPIGQAELVLALLDAEARRRLARLLQGYVVAGAAGPVQVSASLLDGLLVVQLGASGSIAPGDLVQGTLVDVLAVAHRLVLPDDVAARIAENLRSEPETPFHLHGLALLARDFPRHPATREALLAACRRPSSAVRLQAAEALGEEGHETLLALLFSEATDDGCRARAVRALGDRLPAERAEAALRNALSWKQDLTARACLEALERLGGPASEGLLLQALGNADAQLVAAAARCLGRVGTVAAVAPLRQVEASWRGEPGTAAHHAVLEIQARLTGAEAGQLSLAGGEAGALSLAPGEPGRLSLSGAEPDGPGAAPADVPPATRTSRPEPQAGAAGRAGS